MRITTKGVRNPKTASIPTYRKEGMTITKIAEKLGVTRQWVDFVLKRDGDPLDGENMKTNYDYGKIIKPTTKIPEGWKPGDINKSWINNMDGRDYLSEIVRRRDFYTCQICGKKWKEGKRKFDVHHLDENCESIPTYDNYKKFDRMITLCHKCHLNLDTVRNKMVRNNYPQEQVLTHKLSEV
jgi:hypothetical protein